MSQSINQDKFLQQQNIQVEQSTFLNNILQDRQDGIKKQRNMLDVHGRRLSHYWQAGDTTTDVIRKVMLNNIIRVFDPDTYTQKSFKQTKQLLIRQKVKILGIMITMALPFSLYYHHLRPKLQRIKRLYTMQFYNKMGFFSKQLGVKTKLVSKKDLEDSL